MSKHTPGPWSAEKPRWHSPVDDVHIYDGRGQLIARIPLAGPFQSVNEALANGDLIAASSDLKECLDGFADAAQTVIDNWGSGDLAGAVNNLEGWIDTARKISAQAEGEQQ